MIQFECSFKERTNEVRLDTAAFFLSMMSDLYELQLRSAQLRCCLGDHSPIRRSPFAGALNSEYCVVRIHATIFISSYLLLCLHRVLLDLPFLS